VQGPAAITYVDKTVPLEAPEGIVLRYGIRARDERLQGQWDFFVQTTHPGTIQLDGDTVTGRAYIQELARARDGRQGLNYAIYHDRYQRTPDGWKFTERSTRSGTSTPARWQARRPAQPGRPLTRQPGTRLWRKRTATTTR
jgi:hypothetical protein